MQKVTVHTKDWAKVQTVDGTVFTKIGHHHNDSNELVMVVWDKDGQRHNILAAELRRHKGGKR